VYDNQGHIGPWTQWQGNLNAELMIVGQDWGGTEY
jgi:DNA polymerase